MTSDDKGIANSDILKFDEVWFNNISSTLNQIELAYKITEEKSGVKGIKDDDSTCLAKVTVTRNVADGKVEIASAVEYKYDNDSWTHDAPEFVNEYVIEEPIYQTIYVDKKFTDPNYVPAEGESYTFRQKTSKNWCIKNRKSSEFTGIICYNKTIYTYGG